MRSITSVLLLLGFALSAGAQQTVRYIVQLQNAPLLASHGEKAAMGRIEREHGQFEARATAAGFTVIRRLSAVANVAIVEGPAGNDSVLRGMTGVKRAFKERRYQKHFDASIALHQIDSAWVAIPGATFNPNLPTGWNIAGQGIKIGLVDTGIDPAHSSFKAPNMTAPSGFPKWSTNVAGNQALTSGKIIVARSYGKWTAQDVDGHGTAVASVAAGVPTSLGNNGLTLSGVAPAAWIGVYDVDSDHVGSYSDSDILTALDDCAKDGMDVVSMSFGAPDYGGALDPQNQLYQEAFTTLRANGTVLVASAGNDGSEGYTMSAPAVDPGVIAAGAQQSTTVAGNPSVTAPDGTNISAAAAGNNTGFLPSLTAPVVSITKWDSTGLGCTNGSSWPQAGVAAGKILLILRGTCNFAVKVQNALTAGAAAVIVYNEAAPTDGKSPDALINMDLTAKDISTLLTASELAAIANMPSLFVGNTDGQSLLTKTASAFTVTAAFGLDAGDSRQIADFSSRGPDAGMAIKPDVLAAGQSVIAAWCTDITLDAKKNQCDPFGYQLVDGTSFSAPLTAGAVALVRSARPGLKADDYRSLIVNGASPMLDSNGNGWPLQSAGAGSLNVLQSVKSSVTANPTSLSFGVVGSNIATNQQLTLKNLSTVTTTYNLTLEGLSSAPIAGSPVTLASGNTVYMPLPSAALGDYLGSSNQAPILWNRSVTLAAGAAATLTVQAPPVRSTQGVYQGFIDVTASGSTNAEARIPWWFAVPSSTPTAIALQVDPLDLSLDSTANAYNSTIALRFVDSTGVMMAPPSSITVTRLSGLAVASAPYQATSSDTCSSPCNNLTVPVTFPNVWLIDVTAPAKSAKGDTSTFRITSGSIQRDFTSYVN